MTRFRALFFNVRCGLVQTLACECGGLLVSEVLTVPAATHATHAEVPLYGTSRVGGEWVGGILLAALLVGLGTLVVMNVLKESVQRTP